MADGDHRFESAVLGLEQPVDCLERLLPLHPGLEAVLDNGKRDVHYSLDLALAETNLEQGKVQHHPQRLSDHGSCYVSH